jgi:phosphoribosylglycinamide formyltransferase 2
MGVALARGTDINEALAKADRCAAVVKIQVSD